MIKAVVFDMDGVLIDAREWHYEALNLALKNFGFLISREAHLKEFDGLPTYKKLEMLSKNQGFPRQLHGLVNRLKQEYTVDEIMLNCRPTFNHEYALSRLKREGFKIAVASNSIASTIRLMMERAHLIQYLDFYLSNQDVSNAKPDPEIYLLACAKLDLNPAEVLVVEDNENGIKAALKAGVNVLEVASPQEVNYWSIAEKIAEFSRT